MKSTLTMEKMKKNFPWSVRDFFRMIWILLVAYFASLCLFCFSHAENNSSIIYLLAVLLIARYTTGYLYGILGSVISIICINFFFTYPYSDLNFVLAGYPFTFLSMLAVAIVISTMTSIMKEQAEQAVYREKRTKILYAQNQKLADEQRELRMNAERENIRSNLLRAVSHDLRTPLTSILGSSSAVLDNVGNLSEEEIYHLVHDIKVDAEWLIRMIENLLSITRLNNKETKINKRNEVVEEIVAEAVNKTKKRFQGQKIIVKAPQELLMVPMDGILIEQVLINLLENAIRHSGTTEPIELTVWTEGEEVFFEIRDRGKGLDEKEISHLFDGRYNKNLESGDSSRGMGIGLSVCMTIIKTHGGTLEARNSKTGGAVFTFRLAMDSREVING